jgi:hypothetical protein
MLSKLQITGWVVGLLLASAVVFYVYTAPFNYQRLPGVRIGGQLTQHPQNWNTIDVDGVVYLKMEGFPPVVVKVFYATDDGGIITATRPDTGYWAKRVRRNPNGWIRFGEATYALKATEIFGDARLPMLEAYGSNNGMSMRYDFEGEIITGQNEPLHTWEVFYWTTR